MMTNDRDNHAHPFPSFSYHLFVPLFTLLVSWILLLMVKHVMTALELRNIDHRRGGYRPLSAGAPVVGTSATVTPRGEPEEVEGEFGDEEGGYVKSLTLSRVTRAAQSIRTQLFLLLVGVTVSSLPVVYACSSKISPIPGLPFPGRCDACIATAASETSVILSWIFVGGSLVWALMELLAHPSSSPLTRTIMVFITQPLIVAMFVMTFSKWKYFSDQAEECGSTGGLSHNNIVVGGNMFGWDALSLLDH